MMQEIWRIVEGSSNYEVSNFGRVKRKEIIIETVRGRFRLKENILKGSFSKKAGYQVDIRRNDEGYRHYPVVARLVLTAFVRRPEDGEVARHLDDNKYNQVLTNLAWGYPKDNTADAFRNKKLGRRSDGPFCSVIS